MAHGLGSGPRLGPRPRQPQAMAPTANYATYLLTLLYLLYFTYLLKGQTLPTPGLARGLGNGRKPKAMAWSRPQAGQWPEAQAGWLAGLIP